MTKEEAMKLTIGSRMRDAKASEALDKMADNARELGLDYEPDIPFGDNNPGLPWDEVPQAFNDWWDSEYDPTGNPFGKDTHAYWAWAGWKAAEQPAPEAGTWYAAKEIDAMVRDLDIAMNGDNAAPQAKLCDLIPTLIKRLTEQPAQQEPVATLWQHSETGRTRITMPDDITDCDARWFKAADLYTSPPAQRTWVGLTDEDIALIDWESLVTKKDCVRAIETKLKELNT